MLELPESLALNKSTTAPILHVDDDPLIIRLVERYHKKSSLPNPYVPFERGPELLAHLSQLVSDGGEFPLLVLLDINMPGQDGFEVLKAIREQEQFTEVPLCAMLTSSTHSDERELAEALGANSYFVKPDDAKEYLSFFDQIAAATKP